MRPRALMLVLLMILFSRGRTAYSPASGESAAESQSSALAFKPGPAWIPFLLGIYLLASAAAAIFVLADVWSGRMWFLTAVFPGLDFTAARLAVIRPFVYTSMGAVIGGIILSFQGLHIHAAQLKDFRTSFSGSYLMGPWAAGLLGIAAYALVRAGLLAFGGQSSPTIAGGLTAYSYLALGFLTGFAWIRVLSKLDDLAAQLFGGPGDQPPTPPPVRPPGQ